MKNEPNKYKATICFCSYCKTRVTRGSFAESVPYRWGSYLMPCDVNFVISLYFFFLFFNKRARYSLGRKGMCD